MRLLTHKLAMFSVGVLLVLIDAIEPIAIFSFALR